MGSSSCSEQASELGGHSCAMWRFPGNDRRVILGNGLWKRRFGENPGIIGTTLLINGEPYW